MCVYVFPIQFIIPHTVLYWSRRNACDALYSCRQILLATINNISLSTKKSLRPPSPTFNVFWEDKGGMLSSLFLLLIRCIANFWLYLPHPKRGGGGPLGGSLHISSSWAKIRLLTENPLPRLSGSALKVCVVGGWLESKFSDRLWQKPSFSQAEQNEFFN